MNRKTLTAVLTAVLLVCIFATGTAGCITDDDILTPDQVDESMLDTVVKVKGKITYAIENPMGQGGMYMTLGNSHGDVNIRISPELWDSYDEARKSQYREGKTIVAEGVLFMAGKDLVVVHGKYTLTSRSDTSDDDNSE